MNINTEAMWAIEAVHDSITSVMNDGTPSQAGLSLEDLARVHRDLVLLHAMSTELTAKAAHLVKMLDDAEVNHGSLIGGVTLRARDDLRLELSKWAK